MERLKNNRLSKTQVVNAIRKDIKIVGKMAFKMCPICRFIKRIATDHVTKTDIINDTKKPTIRPSIP